VFYKYPVKDSDTPESIASKYYNDPTRHWIILYTNQIIDPYFQWPLSQEKFEQNLIDNFGSIANSQSTLHHYEKRTNVTTSFNYSIQTNTYVSLVGTDVISVDGTKVFPTINNPVIQLGANNVVSFPNGSLVDTSSQLVAVSNYDQFNNVNESHRTINIIKVDYVNQIEQELKQLLNQ
jgi:hypothetical protein